MRTKRNIDYNFKIKKNMMYDSLYYKAVAFFLQHRRDCTIIAILILCLFTIVYQNRESAF
jgi:hypothetical protein